MAALDGYVLNYDAWDSIDPKTKKIQRFKKGDKLDGIDMDSDRLDYLLERSLAGRPMFVKAVTEEKKSSSAAPSNTAPPKA